MTRKRPKSEAVDYTEPLSSEGAPPLEDDDLDSAAGLRRFVVDTAQDGERLDRALATLMPEWSRSRLQQWITEGHARVNGQAVRPRDAVYEGDVIEVAPQPAPESLAFTPEPVLAAQLNVVYQDAELIVLDKPPGLVVHPAAGHWQGTLLNGLLAYAPELASIPRAGIVHRLDADTSGLMVVARTLTAQTDLVRQLQARSVTREYWALVKGETPAAGTIDGPIARDPRNPLRFRVLHSPSAKPAVTHFRRVQVVEAEGLIASWVVCRLETGRTHQIRVHLESLGHPLLGDPVYRLGRPAWPRESPAPAWAAFSRQALHACRLSLRHPASGATMSWFRPAAPDLLALMRAMGFAGGDKPVEIFNA